MAYVYVACAVCVTIFSTGGKFQPVSNFTTFTQAACSYALLSRYIPVLTCFCVIMNIAHMWYSDEIHEANTNEDQHNPERTRRVRTLMFFDEIDLHS